MLLPTSILFETSGFTLEKGGHLETLTLAYETWGSLNATKDNAILLCHGYTSNPHAAGEGGWWRGLIGPGKAIDTDRWFVVCSNMLGSAYGSSGPGIANPTTGKPFGPDFPEFTTNDMVAAQKLLLENLGIEHLAAVVGYSYGGYLTFLWGVTHPGMMNALVVVASAINGRGDETTVTHLRDRFAECPGWNGGHYYDADPMGSIHAKLQEIREETLRNYGVGDRLRAESSSDAEAEEKLVGMASDWAAGFDANALVTLRKAAVAFDARPTAGNITAPLLYVLATTDKLFPPDLAPQTMSLLEDAGVQATYVELESAFGHNAPAADWAKWGPDLRAFLERHAG